MNGILLVDKPQGFTSFDVVAKMRGITGTRKIGHGGTLDPMATGVLPLFLGSATRAVDMLPDSTKEYIATLQLGLTTDTLDSTGEVLSKCAVTAGEDALIAALDDFRGDIEQLPPMYSAVKVDGKRLYELARQNKTVERKPRPVTIHELEYMGCVSEHQYKIRVLCSKGTYIRTLIDDLGAKLECGAVMTALVRTKSAGFSLENCRSIDFYQENKEDLTPHLLGVETVFATLPKITLGDKHTKLFCNGVKLRREQTGSDEPDGNPLRVFGADSRFLGVAHLQDGLLKIDRLFAGRDDR